MQIRMTTKIGGFRDGEEWPDAGGTIDVPDHEGTDLIAVGYAEEVTDDGTGPDDDTRAGREAAGEGDEGAADGPDAPTEPEGDEGAADGPDAVAPDNICPDCGFEAKSAAGLATHQRRHDKD